MGILEITVPKKSLVGPRTIPILVSSSRGSGESASELEGQEDRNEKDTSVPVSSKEDSVVTEPTTQEVEDPQSMEGSNHSNQRRSNVIDHAAVKTVHKSKQTTTKKKSTSTTSPKAYPVPPTLLATSLRRTKLGRKYRNKRFAVRPFAVSACENL